VAGDAASASEETGAQESGEKDCAQSGLAEGCRKESREKSDASRHEEERTQTALSILPSGVTRRGAAACFAVSAAANFQSFMVMMRLLR